MSLWEDMHRRCHPAAWESGIPEPPAPPDWPGDFTAGSRRIDLDEVAGAVPDEDPLPGEPEDDDIEVVDERELGEQNRTEARAAMQRAGVEAIAWYAPVHFHGSAAWGVYVHERLFFGACAELAASLGNERWDTIVSDFLTALDRHELFHGAVEMFALVMEDFAQLRASDDTCAFQMYFQDEYQKTWPTEDCLEERIATGLQFSGKFKTPGFRSALAEMLTILPAAYSTWQAFKTRPNAKKGAQTLATSVAVAGYPEGVCRCALRTMPQGGLGDLWFPEVSRTSLDSRGPVPRWVYQTGGQTTKRFARAVPANVRMQELLHALVRVHQARVISGGKHQAIVFPNGKKVPFPTQRTVPAYLIGDIARALGLTRKDVLAACLQVHV